MKFHSWTAFLIAFIIVTSCSGEVQGTEKSRAIDSTPGYEYRVGLGRGFLGKAIQVTINGIEVISIIGTDEIENYSQRLGTKILVTGVSPTKDVTVRVSVDGEQPYKQTIDLSTGMYLHIYLEPIGLQVYNTRTLILE